MKTLIKRLNVIEWMLLILSPVAILTIGIVFHSDVLTIIASLLGTVNALLLAKGWVFGQVIGIASCILTSIVCYFNGYYGEIIIYIGVSLPLCIWALISWAKHKNQQTQTVEIRKIEWKEWLIIGACSVAALVGIYFLLRALNTNELIVSTLSVVITILAAYLLARRNKFGFLSYIISDLIQIVLWGIPVMQGNLLVLAMLLKPIVNLIIDSYGLINWAKLQRKQKQITN